MCFSIPYAPHYGKVTMPLHLAPGGIIANAMIPYAPHYGKVTMPLRLAPGGIVAIAIIPCACGKVYQKDRFFISQ